MQALRNMKGRFFRVVSPFFAVCSLLLTGCSKEVANGGSEVDSGASGRLKVQTSVLTRSAVDGTVLPQGSAIGVVVTTSDGSAFFTPSATSGSGSADGDYYPDGKNVRFANETGVNMWTSTTADGKTKLLLFSDDERGKVYGYYPWTEDGDIEGEGALATVPVDILNEGTITVAADQTAAANHPAFTAKEEKDYMYSSRQDEVGAKTTTTARLVMEHVLARVSFRMYASSAAQLAVDGDKDSYYEFTGYTLRNRSGSEELIANYDRNTRMKVAGGDITGAVSGGEYVRRIEGYRLERSKGDTPDDDNSVADASLRVGNLCFPVRQISQDGGKSTGIEVVFEVRRMNGDGTVASGPAAYALPLAVVAGESDSWQAGKHYTYTVKFTGSSLSVESVTVTRWNEVPGGNMHIGEDPYVSSAAVTPSGDIPGGGDTYSITLNGLLSVHGTEVRARVDGQEEPLVEGKAFKSGEAVELEVPVNKTGDDRTVVFEYKLNGVWTKIEERRQIGYSISSATTNAPGSIPGPGGTYSVTLEGTLPPEGIEVRAMADGKVDPLVSNTVTASGTAVNLPVPSNESYSSRTVTFEYKLHGEWTAIGSGKSQTGYTVSVTHDAPGSTINMIDIHITLSGWLPKEKIECRLRRSNAAGVVASANSGSTSQSQQKVTLSHPVNHVGTCSTYIEYKWNGEWKTIASMGTGLVFTVGKLTKEACAQHCSDVGSRVQRTRWDVGTEMSDNRWPDGEYWGQDLDGTWFKYAVTNKKTGTITNVTNETNPRLCRCENSK